MGYLVLGVPVVSEPAFVKPLRSLGIDSKESIPPAYVAWHNSSLLRLEFCMIFYPHFSFLQNGIHEQPRIFLFRGLFVRFFKTMQKSLNPPVEGTVNSKEQKTRVFWQIDVQELHLSWFSDRIFSFFLKAPVEELSAIGPASFIGIVKFFISKSISVHKYSNHNATNFTNKISNKIYMAGKVSDRYI